MSTTQQVIVNIIAKEGSIEPANVALDATLQELNVHSLDAIQIIFEIEDRFDITVPEKDADYKTGTVRDLIEGVERLIAAKPRAA